MNFWSRDVVPEGLVEAEKVMQCVRPVRAPWQGQIPENDASFLPPRQRARALIVNAQRPVRNEHVPPSVDWLYLSFPGLMGLP